MPQVFNRRHAGVPDDAVPIERGSEWGNPFRVGVHGTRPQVIEMYRAWLLSDPARVQRARQALAGRDLVCCCKPRPCHGDVLLELANPPTPTPKRGVTVIESPLEDFACAEAEKAGWLVRKLQWVGRRNAPDRFFAKDGRVVLIEFKRPGGQPRPGQEKEIARLRGAGVEVYACDNPLAALNHLGVRHA